MPVLATICQDWLVTDELEVGWIFKTILGHNFTQKQI